LTANIIPDLDEFFSFIAGYCSSATRLGARPSDEIQNAIAVLKKSFVDKHPGYGPIGEAMDQTETLSRKMRVADELRRKLIVIMEQLDSRL
jgi:hypothetical protein